MASFVPAIVQADDVKLKVEVLQAPSTTVNDFNFSTINQTQNPEGRVLGATSSRKNKLNYIYLLFLINPLLIF
jgi:hypothetical protein